MIYYIGSIPCLPSDIRHFGIPGMKWGLRRYRNKDGTLTDAGKRRYGAKAMSDDELRSAINRAKLEEEYNSYYKKPKKKREHRLAKAAGYVGKELGKAAVRGFARKVENAFAKEAPEDAHPRAKEYARNLLKLDANTTMNSKTFADGVAYVKMVADVEDMSRGKFKSNKK